MHTTVCLKDLASLLKLRLSAAVAGAAAAGFILASGMLDHRAAFLFVSILSVAAGAGCFNNWQDQRRDAAMSRTKNRPLPAGRISRRLALALASALMLAGGASLVAGPFRPAATATTALAVLLYLGVYTPLKHRTSIALLPGVVCGSLPPLIGWLAAGASLVEPAAWGLMVVFGLWQPPHFWLVVLVHPDDYLQRQVPSMLRVFSKVQLSRILFTWTAMLGISMLALPLALGMTSPLLYGLELANALALIGLFGWLLLKQTGYRLLFAILNIGVFTGVLLVTVERLCGCI